MFLVAQCRRFPWRWLFLVLFLAAMLSYFLPGAPLHTKMLDEHEELKRMMYENELRLNHSENFLELYKASRQHFLTQPDSEQVDVGITVLTMARGKRLAKETTLKWRTDYLTQSAVGLMELLNDTSLRLSYRLTICNVDDNPEGFTEVEKFKDVIPMFYRYGPNKVKVKDNENPPETLWEKLKLDYVFCLRQTLSRARYALLIEDDAVAHADLFRVMEHVVGRNLEAPGARPVTYVKLYHPRRLLGYISLEVERLSELAALSVTVGALLTLACRCGRAAVDAGRGGSSRSVLMAWLGWTLSVAVVALGVGRANLLELRRLSPQLYEVTPTPSCCLPAMLFPRVGGLELAGYLMNVTCTAKRSTDFRMDEFRELTGARALLVQPSLFSHIGILSSLRTKEVSALVVE